MTRPRRARRFPRPANISDRFILVLGVGTGIIMMLIGWAPTLDVPAPLPPPAPSGAERAAPLLLTGHGPVSDLLELETAALPAAKPGLPPNQPDTWNLDQTPEQVHARPAGSAAGRPELVIEALGIRAPIDPIQVSSGSLEIPDDPARVGRWSGGAGLGDGQGAVLVSGHVAWQGRRGALWGLAAAEPGMTVHLSGPQGGITAWTVRGVRAVVRGTNLPELFRTTGPHVLYLVTCGGHVVDGHYTHTVIVEAAPRATP